MPATCPTCDGHGRTTVNAAGYGSLRLEIRNCDRCDGTGSVPLDGETTAQIREAIANDIVDAIRQLQKVGREAYRDNRDPQDLCRFWTLMREHERCLDALAYFIRNTAPGDLP